MVNSLASMGPRSRDRGIAVVAAVIPSPWWASMGPRSRDRGISGARGYDHRKAAGFNGAAIT